MKKEDEFECAMLNSSVLCFKFCRFVEFPQILKWNSQKNFLACIFTIRLFGDAQEISHSFESIGEREENWKRLGTFLRT